MIYKTDKEFEDGIADKIRYGFFGRTGGVSQGIYHSLNCGLGSNDNPDAVLENRQTLCAELGVRKDLLLTPHQIHSDHCLYVGHEDLGNVFEGDAFVTADSGLLIGVAVADCCPVLFYGETQEGDCVVGAAHAGWGGAFKGILENTVQTMLSRNVMAGSIRAAVGPCIGAQSYEVGPEFRQRFIENKQDNERFFIAAKKEAHYMFDLPSYVEERLTLIGIKQISRQACSDTYSQESTYFSYRRATHNGDSDYGRQLAVISIL